MTTHTSARFASRPNPNRHSGLAPEPIEKNAQLETAAPNPQLTVIPAQAGILIRTAVDKIPPTQE